MTLYLTICPLDAHYYAASEATGTLFLLWFITAHLSHLQDFYRPRLRRCVISKHCYLSHVRSSSESIHWSTVPLCSFLSSFSQLWWQNNVVRQWKLAHFITLMNACSQLPHKETRLAAELRGRCAWRCVRSGR